MPSPTPKPSALRKLEGLRAHRPLNEREWQPEPGEPDLPPDLNGAEADVWAEYCDVLRTSGILFRSDGEALADLSRATVLLRNAHDDFGRAARMIKSLPEDGKFRSSFLAGSRVNPLISVIAMLTTIKNQYLREFGLTPASRTKVESRNDPKAGKLMDALLDDEDPLSSTTLQ